MTIKYGQWNFRSWETLDKGYSWQILHVQQGEYKTNMLSEKDREGHTWWSLCFLLCKSQRMLIIYWCAVLIGWLCQSLQTFCILLSARLSRLHEFFVYVCSLFRNISLCISVLDNVLYVLYRLHMTITSIHFCTISKQMDPTHWICKKTHKYCRC